MTNVCAFFPAGRMPAFPHLSEYPLDKPAPLAPFLAMFYRRLPVLAPGHYGDVAARFQKTPEPVAVVPAIPERVAAARFLRELGSRLHAAQETARQMPVAGHRQAHLRACPCPRRPFALEPPFCPPPWRWAFIVVLSMITSSNPSPTSRCSVARTLFQGPRALPRLNLSQTVCHSPYSLGK